MKKSDYLEVGINIKDAVPGNAIHPGEELREELKDRRITQKHFAEISGILPSHLNEIIKGKRKINAELALLIGITLKIDPIFWLKSQMIYELDLAKIKHKNKIIAMRKANKLAITI